jgi:hypothetical protein
VVASSSLCHFQNRTGKSACATQVAFLVGKP